MPPLSSLRIEQLKTRRMSGIPIKTPLAADTAAGKQVANGNRADEGVSTPPCVREVLAVYSPCKLPINDDVARVAATRRQDGVLFRAVSPLRGPTVDKNAVLDALARHAARRKHSQPRDHPPSQPQRVADVFLSKQRRRLRRPPAVAAHQKHGWRASECLYQPALETRVERRRRLVCS